MKFVVSDSADENFLEKLKTLGEVVYKPADLAKELEGADVLIVRSRTKVDKNLLSKGRKLKLVARAGVGLDNIDVQACEKRKIKVINAPSAVTNSVAELAMGMIIYLVRKIHAAHTYLKQGVWKKEDILGNELKGKTLGLIGFGRIGKRVAEFAKSFGMEIIAYDPNVKEADFALVSLDELLARSDIISLHVALTDETRNMINKETISRMKDGVHIVNTSRGEVVNEEDLYEALKSGKIAGVALDVFKEEPYKGKLLELENVLVTPHIGGNTKEAQERIGLELIELIKSNIKNSKM